MSSHDQSVFRGALEFFGEIGVYDVVLPFLLVFSIVFAILEKTKILGVEKIEGSEYTKKNINALVSFVVSFLVVASTRLVAAINEAVANVVLLLLLSITFLLLVGSFFSNEEEVYLQGGWRNMFMVIMFVGIIFIFLHAIKTEDGTPWLIYLWELVAGSWSTNIVSSIILLIIIIVFMIYLTSSPKPKKEE